MRMIGVGNNLSTPRKETQMKERIGYKPKRGYGVRFTIYTPDSYQEKVERAVKISGVSLGQLFRNLIDSYIENEEKKSTH